MAAETHFHRSCLRHGRGLSQIGTYSCTQAQLEIIHCLFIEVLPELRAFLLILPSTTLIDSMR